MRSMIICVDDDKWLLATLSEQLTQWLGENYAVEKALSGPEALDIIDDCIKDGVDISLVISDYIMPGMKGDALLEQVQRKTPMTRRIMLTGYSALEGITNAINKAGIYRYLAKPWDAKDMMLTVLQAIRSFEQDKHTELLNKENVELYGAIKKINTSLQANLKQTLKALAAAAEVRDGGISGHTGRVVKYASCLAGELGMSSEDKRALETSASLHDVGKLGLNDTELENVRNLKRYMDKNAALKQAQKAKEILGHMEEKVLTGIIYYAERVDGQGAFGMNRASIPINAKIIGLCDYYDTLRSARENASPGEILTVMKHNINKIFDESLFDKFSRIPLE